MKKLLLSLACVLGMSGLASAKEYTINIADNGGTKAWTIAADEQSMTGALAATDGTVFSATVSKGTSNTSLASSQSDDLIKVYKNYGISITGKGITKIVFQCTKGYTDAFTLPENGGACEADETAYTVTWTGSADTFTGTAPVQVRISSMTITADDGSGDVVLPPTPEIETVSNIAGFIEKCTTADYPSVTIDAPVTAIYQNGNNLYVKDASGYLLVFGAVGQTYNNGDVIPAGITGKAQDYSGVYELSSPVTSSFAAGTAGAAVEPEALGLDEISTEQANYYVIVNDATIEAIEGEDMNFNLTAGGETLVLRNKFKLETIPTGEGYTVKAFVGTFGDAAQLYPVEILSESGKETVATPTFSVAAGAVAEGTQVEIECATEGASIFYTIDGTENWLPYTEAIAINEALTLKAYATKDGMDNSAVATADYTIKVVAPITGTEAMFNFVEPATLDPATEVSSNSNSPEHPLDGVTFTSNGIEVTATGGTSVPRIWACYNHGNEYRLYNGATLTVAGANAEILITSIEFAGDQLTAIQPNAEGSSSSYTWTDAEGLNKVEFPIVTKGSYKRADITTIKVTFKKTSGIADVEIDANAPVEYFNLQGVRIEGELTPGLYIRRQGNAAAKVLVR